MTIQPRVNLFHGRSYASPARTQALASWGTMSTPLGNVLVAVNAKGVCAVEFCRLSTEIRGQRKLPGPSKKHSRSLALAIAQLREYFAGGRDHFDLPLDLTALTPFQRRVLVATERIPHGEVWSYQRVARKIRRAKSSRPVGQALGCNPIPIIIPCHRVIASDGTLGGYCGTAGLNIKRWLLRHEGVRL